MHHGPAGAAGADAAAGVGSHPGSHHRHHPLRLSLPPQTDRRAAAAAAPGPLALQEHVKTLSAHADAPVGLSLTVRHVCEAPVQTSQCTSLQILFISGFCVSNLWKPVSTMENKN